jgi:hypothetical protein
MENIGLFYGFMISLMALWYIFCRLGMLYQENLATILAERFYIRTHMYVRK